MSLVPRTVPTGLGTDDKLIDLTLLSLTVFQGLNLLGGAVVAVDVLTDVLFDPIPLLARQIVAGLALAAGALNAFWRIDGRSPWTWLVTTARYARRRRRAVSRPSPVVLHERSDAWWYEVRPDLAWPAAEEAR